MTRIKEWFRSIFSPFYCGENKHRWVFSQGLLDECEKSRDQALVLTKSYEEALNTALNYLNWNADDLCGDDLVGDGRRTMRFKHRIAEIEKTLSSFPTFVLERFKAKQAVIEAAKTLRIHGNDLKRGTHATLLWAALDDLEKLK